MESRLEELYELWESLYNTNRSINKKVTGF